MAALECFRSFTSCLLTTRTRARVGPGVRRLLVESELLDETYRTMMLTMLDGLDLSTPVVEDDGRRGGGGSGAGAAFDDESAEGSQDAGSAGLDDGESDAGSGSGTAGGLGSGDVRWDDDSYSSEAPAPTPPVSTAYRRGSGTGGGGGSSAPKSAGSTVTMGSFADFVSPDGTVGSTGRAADGNGAVSLAASGHPTQAKRQIGKMWGKVKKAGQGAVKKVRKPGD